MQLHYPVYVPAAASLSQQSAEDCVPPELQFRSRRLGSHRWVSNPGGVVLSYGKENMFLMAQLALLGACDGSGWLWPALCEDFPESKWFPGCICAWVSSGHYLLTSSNIGKWSNVYAGSGWRLFTAKGKGYFHEASQVVLFLYSNCLILRLNCFILDTRLPQNRRTLLNEL